MNKKGSTSDDVFEWIKLAIALIIGYMIIKALLSVGDIEAVKETCKCICPQINPDVICLS